ncbi:DNA-3-methyladenine glycosylase [Lacipirellula limnantheis]|uniref:Putative 3-methyladenine DNA glycosylase n=1 Tax=Lacipirellula limnantheis TaxID=2528024 RepID=A0A517TUJ5_9BACT|nr:DNA-3-methyladenine glycosylase [Lacipirellula limnantheis]QDT72050.1 3-methyladenine DNA glycosylase [Lacipirellula limnantheis]
MRRLKRDFFSQPAEVLAPALLGVVMTREVDGSRRAARIVEAEAYLGPHDLAAHSSRGRTARTEIMFGPPGYAYVYLIYGLHCLLNVVAAGDGAAVLLRAADPLAGWTVNLTGPGRLARGFGVTLRDNGIDVTSGDLAFWDDGTHQPKVLRRPRVGVDYAAHWSRRLLRFIDRSSPSATKLR